MSKTLTRYDLINIEHNGYRTLGLDARPEGAWVRYDDAQAALTLSEQAREVAEQKLERWEGNGGLLQAVRDIRGFDADWPEHGNAPLAIAAGYALLNNRVIDAEAERDTLRAQLAEVIGPKWDRS